MNPLDESRTVSLGDVIAILIRRKWLITSMFLVVLAGVTFGTLLTPKQYQARMKVLVKNERADMIVSADRTGGMVNPGEVGETQINSEIELLDSNDLLQQVVVKCGLDRPRESTGPMAGEGPMEIEKATRQLEQNLKITPVRKANVIQVEYTNHNPHLAFVVLRQLSESYLEAHLRVHGTPGTYQFFSKQATRFQNELQDTEVKLASFRQQQNIVMFTEEKNMMLQKTLDAESALMQAEAGIGERMYKVADIRKRLERAEPRVVTQSRTVPNQYSVERLQTMLIELKNRRTLLLAKFRPDDRLVQEADQEIADTQGALERVTKLTGTEQATDINLVHQTLEIDLAKEEAELSGMEARRRALARQAQNYREQVRRLGNATAGYDDLVRNQKEAEDNYLLYSKKAEEARIADSLDQQKIANVAISETPTEPQLPSRPNVQLNLSLGVLLAGFLSLAAAFGVEYFVNASGYFAGVSEYISNTVEQPFELEALTGLPVLATILTTPFLSAPYGGTGDNVAGTSPSYDA